MVERKQISVLIADDFKILREVIRLYLDRAEDINVVDEALDLDDALESAIRLQPDVIIMNDYLPPVDSAHATALFRKTGVTAAILVISMQPESNLIRRSFESGVNGFMHKEEIEEHLVDAVRRVYESERYLSPKAKDALSHVER